MSKNMYALPCRKKDIQAIISDPSVHKGPFTYAIDFILPEGSIVTAAKGGIVVDLMQDSHEGGNNKSFFNKANYITIQHRNNEYSQYVHLKHKSITVKKGERVKQGQSIALSGNTGYSTTPHLHFQVFTVTKKEPYWKLRKITFKEKIRITRTF